MNKEILSVLNKIENNGFVAYIVGGYVRDYLLKLPLTDVDIITNATPKDLSEIFDNIKKTYIEYGSVKLYINNQIIDITSMRKDLLYKNNKPVEIEYTNDVESDLKRRDFKMNTLLMDKDGNIIDLLGGKLDIYNKVITPVNEVNTLFMEDKTRVLRAIRFMTTLNMKLDASILNYIINNKEVFTKISNTKIKSELDKIFKSKRSGKFISFIKQYNLEEYIGIIPTNKFKSTHTLVSSYAELKITRNLPFTKYEKESISKIKKLIEKKSLTKWDIYKNGLYISMCASEVLGISKKEINLIYTNLPINSIIDIDLKPEEICSYLNIEPNYLLGKILHKLEYDIIMNNVPNKKEILLERISDYINE